MLDKYEASKRVLIASLREVLEMIDMLKCVPKDGVKAYGILKLIKHYKEVLPFRLNQYNFIAYDCLCYLKELDNQIAKNQIDSITAEKLKYNQSVKNLLKEIDFELEKTALNI